jgi:hypothetical protein
MASYWIVVPRGNAELFDLLSIAFKGRTGFSVIMDRRAPGATSTDGDRRARGEEIGPDEIVVAEQAERAGQAGRARGSEEVSVPLRTVTRPPTGRRLPKQAESGVRRQRTAAPLQARGRQRLFSL